MSEPGITRERAMTWTGVLFVLSVFGTAFVIHRYYHGQRLWLGALLYAALFAGSWVMGLRAKAEDVRRGLSAAIPALIQPAPWYALGVIAIVLALFLCGWSWVWRSTLPLAGGIVAGYKWARQQPGPPEPPKTSQDAPPPMDLWKP